MNVSVCCADCGEAAAIATFGKTWCNPNATWYEAVCDVCKQIKSCTEPRDFRRPNFDLLPKKKAA